MAGNSYGKLFRVTTFGESHGTALGCVIDGVPSGMLLDIGFIQSELDRRRPGTTKLTTARNEGDRVDVLSGLFDGYTTGMPICFTVGNNDQHSRDYSDIKDIYRPGHADFTYQMKYGIRDYRGGGRSSGRETTGRVIAGAVAKQILRERYNIEISAATVQIHDIRCTGYDFSNLYGPLRCPDREMAHLMEKEIEHAAENRDSVGGMIECRIDNVPAGWGEPVFDKLDAELAKAVFSIGAVKGFEIGEGFNAASLLGSENNDEMNQQGFATNHAGGVLGGISNGNQIVFRCAIKPTPSISGKQNTVDMNNRETVIEIKGRHDPCICQRVMPVIEAMAAIVLVNAAMENME